MTAKTDYTIIVDSREQKPWWNNCEVAGLKTGDYSIKGHEEHFAIERKSLPDLLQTLTSGHQRFKKELARATQMRYFAILVEGSYSDMAKKKWANSWRSRVQGHTILSIVNTLRVKYGIQIIFASSRVEAKSIARGLMTAYMKIKWDDEQTTA